MYHSKSIRRARSPDLIFFYSPGVLSKRLWRTSADSLRGLLAPVTDGNLLESDLINGRLRDRRGIGDRQIKSSFLAW